MKKIGKILAGVGANLTIASMALANASPYNIQPTAPTDLGDVQGKISSALGIAQFIGFVVAIIMLIWVGVKYLTSGAGKQAEAKDMLVPLIVGAALVALAGPIANWVWGLVGGSGTVSEGT